MFYLKSKVSSSTETSYSKKAIKVFPPMFHSRILVLWLTPFVVFEQVGWDAYTSVRVSTSPSWHPIPELTSLYLRSLFGPLYNTIFISPTPQPSK